MSNLSKSLIFLSLGAAVFFLPECFLLSIFFMTLGALNCPNKFSRKAESVSENLRVATLKGEHFDGGEEPAAECDTRLDVILN